MAPSVTPARTSIRIHGRDGIHFWCCIDRIFFHHHSGRRDYDRPPNDDCLRLRYNDSGRGSVLVSVSFTLVGGTTGGELKRQGYDEWLLLADIVEKVFSGWRPGNS
jgi:hypothetical protein